MIIELLLSCNLEIDLNAVDSRELKYMIQKLVGGETWVCLM